MILKELGKQYEQAVKLSQGEGNGVLFRAFLVEQFLPQIFENQTFFKYASQFLKFDFVTWKTPKLRASFFDFYKTVQEAIPIFETSFEDLDLELLKTTLMRSYWGDKDFSLSSVFEKIRSKEFFLEYEPTGIWQAERWNDFYQARMKSLIDLFQALLLQKESSTDAEKALLAMQKAANKFRKLFVCEGEIGKKYIALYRLYAKHRERLPNHIPAEFHYFEPIFEKHELPPSLLKEYAFAILKNLEVEFSENTNLTTPPAKRIIYDAFRGNLLYEGKTHKLTQGKVASVILGLFQEDKTREIPVEKVKGLTGLDNVSLQKSLNNFRDDISKKFTLSAKQKSQIFRRVGNVIFIPDFLEVVDNQENKSK